MDDMRSLRVALDLVDCALRGEEDECQEVLDRYVDQSADSTEALGEIISGLMLLNCEVLNLIHNSGRLSKWHILGKMREAT